MNDFIGAKVLGRTPEPHEQPNILQDYANTSSAGSIVAFSKYSDDLPKGSLGVICSFGAGYSAGSVIVRKLSPPRQPLAATLKHIRRLIMHFCTTR